MRRSIYAVMKTGKTSIASVFTIILISLVVLAGCLSGCGSSYEYTKGTVEWYSTYTPGKLISDTFYYSDDWFSKDPSSENKELALASMQLTAAAVTDDMDAEGAEFLKNMGFEEIGFSGFDSNDPTGCSYTWGRKTIGSGRNECTLVAVVLQSHALDNTTRNRAWKQNFTVNDPEGAPVGEHYGFASAADSAAGDIAALADSDKVKFWIMGQSRGGAIANIIAERLPQLLGDKNTGIYAYTFESPATVDADIAAETECKYIHNYICSDDFVTMVPAWGMTRYGVMHDLKNKDTDKGLTDMLAAIGSDAADLKPRIIASDQAEHLAENVEKAIPSRLDYSTQRMDKWISADGQEHEVTYSCQEAMTSLMDIIFDDSNGEGEESTLDKLLGKREKILSTADRLAEGIRLERQGSDAWAEYWDATESIYNVLEDMYEDEKVPFSKEDLYMILRTVSPILIDVPEDPAEDISAELLVNLAGYSEEMTFSHQFDTIIARLKIIAPEP